MPSQRSIVLLHGIQSGRTAWWLVGRELAAAGWRVSALDLLGHGARAQATDTIPTLDELATDVIGRLQDVPVDVLAGHSLGAIVALTAARLRPDVARAVFIGDPPGPVDRPRRAELAEGIRRSVRTAREDPDGTARTLPAANPRWSAEDARHAVENRRQLNLEQVTAALVGAEWDLPKLVTDCPVPLFLLAAAGAATALREPDRGAVVEVLGPERVRVVESGHSVDRDEPGVWLEALGGFAASLPQPL